MSDFNVIKSTEFSGSIFEPGKDSNGSEDDYGSDALDYLPIFKSGGEKEWSGFDAAESKALLSGPVFKSSPAYQSGYRKAINERVIKMEGEHDANYLALDYLLKAGPVEQQFDIVGRKLAENLNLTAIDQQVYHRYAEQRIKAMKMREAVQTGYFLADMRRAMQRFRKALASGDRQAAYTAHEQARLNLELGKLSRGIIKRRESVSG